MISSLNFIIKFGDKYNLMSDRVGLLLKMLLPSVAISIAINSVGNNLTLEPNDSIALIAVFVPSIVMGLFIYVFWVVPRGTDGLNGLAGASSLFLIAASITGGYVYRGKKFPELVGAYIFGDWETRRIWAALSAVSCGSSRMPLRSSPRRRPARRRRAARDRSPPRCAAGRKACLARGPAY